MGAIKQMQVLRLFGKWGKCGREAPAISSLADRQVHNFIIILIITRPRFPVGCMEDFNPKVGVPHNDAVPMVNP